jgi:hypothetical protein
MRPQNFLNGFIGLGIDASRALVDEHYLPLVEQRASDVQKLPFAHTEILSSFADDSLQSLPLFEPLLKAAANFERVHDLLV